MISNADCTILTRSVNQDRQYSWSKSTYKNVYFECNKNSSTDEKPKEESNCYCCIYNQTPINANIGDIIAKGVIEEDNINITDIKNKYQTFNISKIAIYDTGNIKHIEIEGF